MDIYLPTQAEILKACREIRSTWSSRELFKRAGVPEPTGCCLLYTSDAADE